MSQRKGARSRLQLVTKSLLLKEVNVLLNQISMNNCSRPLINALPPSTGSPANRVSLQELMRQYSLTDKQLNREIINSEFSYLAKYFDDVEIYSNAMELDPAEQADVKRLHHSEGSQAAMMKCLKTWKQHNSSRATYRALLDIVLSLGKGDTADRICRQLTQRISTCVSVPAPPPFPLPSAAPVQRVETTPASEDSQVRTRILGIFPEAAMYVYVYGCLMFAPLQDHLLIESLFKN